MGVTLTTRTRQFPVGTDLIPAGMATLQSGTSYSASAAQNILLPDPGDPSNNLTYRFLFWNAKGNVTTTATLNIPNIGSDDFSASSWYIQTGGGSGPPTVSTYAFSITQDLILPGTPIQSVSPAAAWTGGNSQSVATGSAAVNITAKASIGTESFQGWIIFGSGTPSGTVLSVPHNGSAIAMATYKEPDNGGLRPPGIEFEVWEVLEGIRERVKDWIFDPAPFDMARLAGRFSQTKLPARQDLPDDLSELTARIEQMDVAQLRVLKSELQTREARMDAAIHMVDASMKARSKAPGRKGK